MSSVGYRMRAGNHLATPVGSAGARLLLKFYERRRRISSKRSKLTLEEAVSSLGCRSSIISASK
jgi:hypothetical protein